MIIHYGNLLYYHHIYLLAMGKGQRIQFSACFSMLTGCRDGQALCMLSRRYRPALANNHRSRTPSGHRVTNFQPQQVLESGLATMHMHHSGDYHITSAL